MVIWKKRGAVLIDVQLLGYQRIRLLGTVPAGYRYPHPDSYQVLYLARVAELIDFVATEEASQRAFFAPTAARELTWVQENWLMYEQALTQVRELGLVEVLADRRATLLNSTQR